MAKENPNALPQGYKLRSTGGKEYIIKQMLGSGGCGITYLVTTVETLGNIPVDVDLVVKEYFHSTSCMRDRNTQIVSYTPGGKELVERGLHDFFTEAERLHSLCGKNANIVKVNEVFKANGTAYYVMEYLDGGDLSAYCNRRGGRLSEAEALHFMGAVCSAVNFLHENRLLHLDIKPQNVVLRTNRQNRELTPVLIDFGLTRHFDKKGNPTSYTEIKSHTDGYAPQEQYAGIDKFSPTADIYAMGGLLFFMLTGKDPVRAFECSQAYLKNNLPEGLSDRTRNAVLQAMRRDITERTPSVALFADNLGIRMGNVTITEDDPIKPVPGWLKWLKSHLSTVLIVVLAAALVGVLLGRKAPVPAGERYLPDVRRVLADEGKRMDIDSLLYANQRMDEAVSNGESDPALQQELDAAVDKLFNLIVANGDNSSLPEVKRNCYSQALQLKYDSKVEKKFNQL